LGQWTSETESAFDRWFSSLGPYKQAVLSAAIENVLEVYGMDICSMEWGKNLGGGLYEFRIRQSLHAVMTFGNVDSAKAKPGEDQTVLLRVFITFHGEKVVLLMSGYDKGKDNSDKRQNKEIAKARSLLTSWKAARLAAAKADRKSQ
jgi:putative component of toxin-antitoxin plasmid stabilization module